MTPGARLLALSLRERGLPAAPRPETPDAALWRAVRAASSDLHTQAQLALDAARHVLQMVERAASRHAGCGPEGEYARELAEAVSEAEAAVLDAALPDADLLWERAALAAQPGDWAGPRHANGDVP